MAQPADKQGKLNLKHAAITMAKWAFWIDRGGTFTDIIARQPDGTLVPKKVLSHNPDIYEDAVIFGIRNFMQTTDNAPIDTSQIETVRIGTTVATNALLERKGAPTLLATNQGFEDILAIGTQARPDIFALEIKKPQQLYQKRVGLMGRVQADGTLLEPFDEAHNAQQLQNAYDEGLRSIAISLMHGHAHPQMEQQAADIAHQIGFTHITTGHEMSRLIKFMPRTSTAMLDAYLTPILHEYVQRLQHDLPPADGFELLFMTSSGGLTDPKHFIGRDAILSGPAGGIIGAVETGKMAGHDKIIGFDMGGTSTDVSHYHKTIETRFETEIEGLHHRAPMLNIHTVAAGGGSILGFDGQSYLVGPHSAGAHPGPACYGHDGPLTVTDANVMLGRLSPKHFPHHFGPNQNEPLNKEATTKKFETLAQQTGQKDLAQMAEGYFTIAVEHMAQAIKKISIEQGHEPQDYALLCFGGAGGQHACAVAKRLGLQTILVHPFASVLSAYGMGLAQHQAHQQQTIGMPLTQDKMAALNQHIDDLQAKTRQHLMDQGVKGPFEAQIEVHLNYQGTQSALPIAPASLGEMQQAYEQAHQQRFGFTLEDTSIIVDMIDARVSGGGAPGVGAPQTMKTSLSSEPIDETEIYIDGQWHKTPIYQRDQISAQQRLQGPCLIVDALSTLVVEPGWQCALDDQGQLVLNHQEASENTSRGQQRAASDPIQLALFSALFMSIAEQMGAALQQTACSTNIKERLDFSCALFDAKGELVANAPHTPVHLGSMDRAVQSVMRHHPNMQPGDHFATNAPYDGGTHLPDITVVTPVFVEGETPAYYVASRGHHADIGGIAPGSMSPLATHIDEEGVLFNAVQLAENGRFLETEIRTLLLDGPYPARNPDNNIADLQAQMAANQKGMAELILLSEKYGVDHVHTMMGAVMDYGEKAVRKAISALKDGAAKVEFDQGCAIEINIKTNAEKGEAILDFTGTSAQQKDNFNAPEPVTRAAVLYAFRCLIKDTIPLNAGCMRPLKLIIPDGSMLKPAYPAAVVAGNVEVSQAVTDCLFAAMGVMSGAQGTMNNFNFGNQTHQYYETNCGGTGAGDGFDGTDAIHSHMTNTRLTDPEILETRYPVILNHFAIRKGSGGGGKYHGGEGVTRTIQFLEEMDVSLLTGHRTTPPQGLNGGGNGALGQNQLHRADGETEKLEGRTQFKVQPGDKVTIRTPGGGGFGSTS